MSAAPRHFLDLIDIAPGELRGIIDGQPRHEGARPRAAAAPPIAGKMLAMIFDKPSTRTRVSFDVAMRQLGGDTIVLTGQEMQLGRGETIADTARVLSRYVDAIMIRTLDHEMLLELAHYATVPVINGLTRRSHPCQVMADVMTFEEHRGLDPRPQGGMDGRRQQRAHLVDACGPAIRFRARGRDAARARAEPKPLLDWVKASGADDRHRPRSRGRGDGRRLRRHRHLGVDGRQATARAGTTCCGPIRSTAR